jgi:hypothetical protein
MGRKEETHDPETPYQGANYRRLEECPGRSEGSGPVPETQHLSCHLAAQLVM